jgi:hypothetical protein
MFPWLLGNSKTTKPRIFFVAEAPGQWIYSTQHYSTIKGLQPEWIATTLNPAIYMLGGFPDSYGFIRKNRERWLWGADNTGDIINTANQRWFREKVKALGPLDLITSDAGMDIGDPTMIQKLELAQVLMVLGCSSNGGACCIKHFLPYVRETPITKAATGFFLQLMYLYTIAFTEVNMVKPMTSSQNTGEFYIVARGFKGIKQEFYDDLLEVLDKHEANKLFFDMTDIPESFITQIASFMSKLTDMNINRDEQTNLLLTCILRKDPIIEATTSCSEYLKPVNIKTLQDSRFKTWISEHKFYITK